MNYIKAMFFGCLIFSMSVFSGYGIYSYLYQNDLIIECTEKAYKNGYQKGFLSGKEIGDTDIKAGLIGEIGTSAVMSEDEKKTLKAFFVRNTNTSYFV